MKSLLLQMPFWFRNWIVKSNHWIDQLSFNAGFGFCLVILFPIYGIGFPSYLAPMFPTLAQVLEIIWLFYLIIIMVFVSFRTVLMGTSGEEILKGKQR